MRMKTFMLIFCLAFVHYWVVGDSKEEEEYRQRYDERLYQCLRKHGVPLNDSHLITENNYAFPSTFPLGVDDFHSIFQKINVNTEWKTLSRYDPVKELGYHSSLPIRTPDEIKRKFPWIKHPKAAVIDEPSALQNGERPRCGDFSELPSFLNLSANIKFVNEHGNGYETDANPGFYRVPLGILWKDIPIYKAGITVEQDSHGYIYLDSIDGTLLTGIDDDISESTPKLSSRKALNLAFKYNKDDPTTATDKNVKLILNLHNRAKLSYRVDYVVLKGTSKRRKRVSSRRHKFSDIRRPVTFLDAYNGQVYWSWDGMNFDPESNPMNMEMGKPQSDDYYSWVGENVAPESTPMRISMKMGNPRSGNETYEITVQRSGTTCEYRFRYPSFDLTVSDFVPEVTGAQVFDCASANSDSYDFTNGALSPRNAAYRWSRDIINYIQKVSGKTLTKSGKIAVLVHFNAKKISFYAADKIYLGDGGSSSYPLTEPDVIAHEIGHLFTEKTSMLENIGHQSEMNEAFSDMLAVAFLDKEGIKHNFSIGQLYKKHGKERDLCNPRSTAVFEQNYETMRHAIGGGVYSKAFCLLSKTSGWNVQKAFKVFTRANLLYWQTATNYNQGTCGVRKAAEDLVSDAVSATKAVDEAFAAVGVACNEYQRYHRNND